MDKLDTLKDVQVGIKNDRDIQKSKNAYLRKNDGKSLADLLKSMHENKNA